MNLSINLSEQESYNGSLFGGIKIFVDENEPVNRIPVTESHSINTEYSPLDLSEGLVVSIRDKRCNLHYNSAYIVKYISFHSLNNRYTLKLLPTHGSSSILFGKGVSKHTNEFHLERNSSDTYVKGGSEMILSPISDDYIRSQLDTAKILAETI